MAAYQLALQQLHVVSPHAARLLEHHAGCCGCSAASKHLQQLLLLAAVRQATHGDNATSTYPLQPMPSSCMCPASYAPSVPRRTRATSSTSAAAPSRRMAALLRCSPSQMLA